MPSVAASPSIRINPLSGFIAVQPEMLRRLRNTAVDLFVQYQPNCSPLLYHRAGREIGSTHLASLLDTGVQRIYVRTADFQSFGGHLLESLDDQTADEPVAQTERFAALQLALSGEIERTAHLIDCGPYVALSQNVSRSLTSLLAASDVLPRDLYRLARHDFNTFTHVTNVASYSILLARRLGISSEAELEQIATGAMLHDIGKRFIPAAVLTKAGRLDRRERALIETHPQRGYEDLCRRKDVTVEQLLMTYQHHERLDGKGYPVGIVGDEIHPWAKLLAVVDVFDAMTGTRPYRRRATVEQALSYLRQHAGTHFDREVVACWHSAMSAN